MRIPPHILRAIRATGYADRIVQRGGGVVCGLPYRDMEGGITIVGEKPCCLLIFDNEDALLQRIDAGHNSASKRTVLAAAHLAKERGAAHLVFTDNTDNLYFLTTGSTWYESIFPCGLVSPRDQAKYMIWKRRVQTNTWIDVYTCLKREYPDLDVGEQDPMAMQALRELGVEFVAKYEAELLMCSGVGSLYGLTWHLPLQ